MLALGAGCYPTCLHPRVWFDSSAFLHTTPRVLGIDELPTLVVSGSIPERGANQVRRDQGSEEALNLGATVRVRTAPPSCFETPIAARALAPLAPLAQQAEASGLSPEQSQFESVVEHQLFRQFRIHGYRRKPRLCLAAWRC